MQNQKKLEQAIGFFEARIYKYQNSWYIENVADIETVSFWIDKLITDLFQLDLIEVEARLLRFHDNVIILLEDDDENYSHLKSRMKKSLAAPHPFMKSDSENVQAVIDELKLYQNEIPKVILDVQKRINRNDNRKIKTKLTVGEIGLLIDFLWGHKNVFIDNKDRFNISKNEIKRIVIKHFEAEGSEHINEKTLNQSVKKSVIMIKNPMKSLKTKLGYLIDDIYDAYK